MTSISSTARKIIRIPTETELERNGSFVAVYCRNMQPYLNYDRPINCPRDQKFAHIMMQLRWDGVFGFPGGKVDPGETLRQACVREAMEEINLAINEADLIPVCSHKEEGGNFAAHLYALEVDASRMLPIIQDSWSALDAEAEVCGVIAPRISMYGAEQGKGILQFATKTPMSFSAKHELITMLETRNLVDESGIKLFHNAMAAA